MFFFFTKNHFLPVENHWCRIHNKTLLWTQTPHNHTMTGDVALFLSYKHTLPDVSVPLTLSGPFVWLQHQVLFGLFQFFLQTLVLSSDLADSLLAVLQQAKLGTDVHHLLTHREKGQTDRQIWI